MQRSGVGCAGGVAWWGWAALLGAASLSLQDTVVQLPEGPLVGIKIFPDSSSTPIEIFLGVPYAAPPVGRLRFSAPVRHPGWNRTLFAHEPAAPCHPAAPAAPAATSAHARTRYSEDCLALNVWVPQRVGGGGGGALPVVVLLAEVGGGGGAEDTAGVALAAGGALVVQPAWRRGALGWLSLGAAAARGNLALLDQYLALRWVRERARLFGGDPAAVTLLAHGAAALHALHHLASPRVAGLFQRAVLMSPPALASLLDEEAAPAAAEPSVLLSRQLAARLGCSSAAPAPAGAADERDVVRCLQQLPVDRVVSEYHALATESGVELGAVCDSYLAEAARYLPQPLAHALLRAERLPTRVPLLFGVNDMEALGRDDEWWHELVARGARAVLRHATRTAIPALLKLHRLDRGDTALLTEAVVWQYWLAPAGGGGGGALSGWQAGEGLARAESAARWGAPAAPLATRLARLVAPAPLYLYRYTQPGGVDLGGQELNHTGAAHGTALTALLGAPVLAALARRRPTPAEARLTHLLRFVTDFAKYGTPLTGRARDEWPPHRAGAPHVHPVRLLASPAAPAPALHRDDDAAFWLRYLPALLNISSSHLEDSARDIQRLQSSREGDGGRLRGAVYALSGVSAVLLLLLGASGLVLQRAAAATAAAA